MVSTNSPLKEQALASPRAQTHPNNSPPVDIPLREPYGAEAYVKKQARIIMAAERKKRHDEKMATINDQQDK